nr:hypothetical protein [Euryarchaeota archaeon]
MSLSAKFQDQAFVTNLVVIIVFAAMFPAYFGYVSSNTDTIQPGGGGPVGTFNVSFTESTLHSDEEVLWADDGETTSFTFSFPEEMEVPDGSELGYVLITLTYDESDEGGSYDTQCDDVDGEFDISQAETSTEGHTLTVSASDCGSYTMMALLTDDYDGLGYSVENISRGEIIDMWQDNGNGHGDYSVTVTCQQTPVQNQGLLIQHFLVITKKVKK